jgi:hypothetical protein
MLLNGLAIFIFLLAFQQPTSPSIPRPAQQPPTSIPTSTVPARPLTTASPAATRPIQPRPAPVTTTTPPPTNANSTPDCNGFPCDTPQPRVIPVNPPPMPTPWPWYERVSWAAYVVLAALGYVGIMLALATLKKIERATEATEAAAQAAQNTSQAALLNAQAIIDSERPWILISVEPSLHTENGFTITATNRGRSPAQIVSTAEQVKIAADETQLPKKSEIDHREPLTPQVPVILLPGEFVGLRTFSRGDARGFCESDEQFARIETWEEKIYLFGRVVYRDLIGPPESQFHQTDWCCWYIHGRQKSGLVTAGAPEYNLHT